MDRVAVLIPLLVGSGAVACTVVVHGAALVTNLSFVRHERTHGHMGAGFWTDLRIVATSVMIALIAHLIEIGGWALLLVRIGEFQEFGIAFYHSAMNYTSLGYGDIIMSPAWKMLGPFEATNGLLMFGVSTGMIFAVIQRMAETRFPDLRT
ncbi:MAG TPA: ion channel [Myxococcota bacterium]|nr:ion channel [Myxococcota bacterium]